MEAVVKEENRVRTFVRERSFPFANRISWAAILAGAVLTLAIQLMLSLLGVGVGAATINPNAGQNAMSGLGAGSILWLIFSSIIALFVGGCVAGRLSGFTKRVDGLIHGAVVWGATTLVTLYFLTSAAGGLISGAAGMVGGIASAGSQIVGKSPQLSAELQQQLRERGITREELQKQAQDEQKQAEVAEKAKAVGSSVLSGISKAGLVSFFVMLLGLAAAAWGGAAGAGAGEIEPVPTEKAA
jgi:hypothetical protein